MMDRQANPFSLIIVGGLMLVVGIAIGYFSRPFIAAQATDLAIRAESSARTEDIADRALVGAGVATPVIIATAMPIQEQDTAPGEPPTAATNRRALMDAVVADTRHFKGSPDAPVTIIEFSDFQCPYCGRFALEAGTQIDEKYIQSGQVRFGYRHFAFLGEPSLWAAEASECAADQDAFWEYHDHLVQRLAVEGKRDFTKENLKLFADELGLDTGTFNACLDQGKYAAIVQEVSASAEALGVRSTPSFLVNGREMMGAQPFAAFEQVIQQAMSEDQ